MDEVLVIVEVRGIRDAEAFKAYQTGARQQLAQFGGRVLARGGRCFEGEASGPLLVQAWKSEEAFLRWQASAEYAPLRELRQGCVDLRITVLAPATPVP